jgi:hypothetical protein
MGACVLPASGEEVVNMGTKLGAWITRYPFHTGGKLPAGERVDWTFVRVPGSPGKGWHADDPWPMRGIIGRGYPDATVAFEKNVI